MTKQHRGFSHGATFDWRAIAKALASETPEYRYARTYVRRVWLGTFFGITPSGKVYAPFACSNVAGDCTVCGGTGELSPRTGKRQRKRAARRERAFGRGVATRGFLGAPAAQRYQARIAGFRDRAFRATSLACPCCDGTGSKSAARDERWHEALEQAAEAIGAYVAHHDDSIFIEQSCEAPECPGCGGPTEPNDGFWSCVDGCDVGEDDYAPGSTDREDFARGT